MPPTRRPSASAGHINALTPSNSTTPNHSTSRIHRSNDSHAFTSTVPHGIPYASSTTPQQKMITILVNRLKNKLPINSGSTICIVEADEALQQSIETLVDLAKESVDITGWALAELLDKIAKPSDAQRGYIETLQSQLMLLKVLCLVLASRWRDREEQTSPRQVQKGKGPMSYIRSLPNSPTPAGKRSRQSSHEQLASLAASPWMEPLPLDDNCAKYILSVMVVYLRQTSQQEPMLMPFDNLNFYTSFHDFETTEFPGMPSPIQTDPSFGLGITADSITMPRSRAAKEVPPQGVVGNGLKVVTPPLPQHYTTYEKTSQMLQRSSLSLNLLISKFVGRIIYHLSASNWSVVEERIRQKISVLAAGPEDNVDIVDLQLMSHSLLDKPRLISVLQQLSSLLINMKGAGQAAIAAPLRSAVWNWIETFPNEYRETLSSRSRLEGAPERVYDMLFNVKDIEKAPVIWPALTALLCASSLDKAGAEFATGLSKSSRKDRSFVDSLLKNVTKTSKFGEVAIVCLLDFARGTSRAGITDDYAVDIAHELKTHLMNYRGKKPFWDADEIDVAVISAALVAIFRALPEEEAIELFVTCLDPGHSAAVKLCVVKACLMLTIDRHRLPWQKKLDNLVHQISPMFRDMHLISLTNRPGHDVFGNLKKIRSRPKARKPFSEIHEDRELLVFGIMTLWRGDLPWHALAVAEETAEEWVPNALVVWSVPSDNAMKLSVARAYRAAIHRVFTFHSDHPRFTSAVLWMKLVTPASLIVVSNNLINCRFDLDNQQMWMGIMYGLMECYTRQSNENHIKDIQFCSERVAAFAVAEMACLISLSSNNSNVSLTAARCLRHIAEAERVPGAPLNPEISEEERAKRYPVYDQLGDPKVPLVGRALHQKRTRKLLRLLASASPMHTAVWEECYYRCRILGESVRATSEAALLTDPGLDQMSLEDRNAQWLNLTLFLAAFGASIPQDIHDPRALTKIIPQKSLPDQMCASKDPSALQDEYLTYLIDLLVADNPFTRLAAREALGTELSPKLYARVFKYLGEVIQDITDPANIPDWQDSYEMFLDQFLVVLKTLVDQTQHPDDIMNAELMTMLVSFAGFLNRFDHPACRIVRARFCSLCDSTLQKSEALVVRRENLARQQILEHIFEWVVDHQAIGIPFVTALELNLQYLRTITALLDRLDIQPDESMGEDVQHVLNRFYQRISAIKILFNEKNFPSDEQSESSFNSELKGKSTELQAEVRDLIIKSSASLISANTDIGLKHAMQYVYHDDLRERAIFARTFSVVLGAGTRFDGPSSAAQKQSGLCELVKGSELLLALAICETCPSNEVDFMIPVLLNLFDTRESLMNLLKAIVDREVAAAENETSLFRNNTTGLRLLSTFAKIHGYTYLRSIIQPLVKIMNDRPGDKSYDIDPLRATNQNRDENLKSVETVTSAFLDVVTSSVHSFPPMLHEICAHIGKAVNQVWPEAKFAALGAFVFLRFISPAIVTPSTVDIETPQDEPMRRGLMIVAKIIQNLANNIFFGKEQHMTALNGFLQAHIVHVTRFLSELNKYTHTEGDGTDDWLGFTYDDTDTIVLHRFFDKHADKVGKELLSFSKSSPEMDNIAAVGKKAWDNLCETLVEMGQPMEVPQPSNIHSAHHDEFRAFMAKLAHRDTTPIEHLFMEIYRSPVERLTFVLLASRIEADTVDLEVLLYHCLKTILDPRHGNQPFDMIVDMTGFTSSSQHPVQWLKYVTEVIPNDVRARMGTVYYLNINAVAYRYLRRLHNLSAGSYHLGTGKAFTSLNELLDHVPQSVVAPLAQAAALEEEPVHKFQDVVMRQEQFMRFPVVLDVARTHIRLTSIKAQPLSSGVSCRPTEIIYLSDISDIYNVATGQDPNEFIIRRIRHGVTLYFSSPHRDIIIKSIRTAKGAMTRVNFVGPERYSRLSNLTATLLHIGFVNCVYEDDDLRNAGFELISAVCHYLEYDGPSLAPLKGAFLVRQTTFLVNQLSARLAAHAPQLSLDFLTEAAVTMNKVSVAQRIQCLHYMSPWVNNLGLFADPTSRHYEYSGARLRDCIRILIDFTVADQDVYAITQRCIWSPITSMETPIVDIVLDELMRSAVDGGISSQRFEIIADTVGTLSSIRSRARIVSKLRKVIGKTTQKPTKLLSENPNWPEIAALTRLAVVSSAQCKSAVQSQLFLAEAIHLIALISATGETVVRLSLHGVVMNLLLNLTMGKTGEEAPAPEITALLDDCTTPETLTLFGLGRTKASGEYFNVDLPTDKKTVENQEGLTRWLDRMVATVAGSQGLLNVWRARWMSLVASTAFQYSPAIQARSFITLGVLATTDLDEDLFYQMLVAFKNAMQATGELDGITIIAMIRCFIKVVPLLPVNSRFHSILFWLSVALLECSYWPFYIDAADLLSATIRTMCKYGAFDQRGVSETLMREREGLEEVATEIEKLLGLSFTSSFSFSLAAIIFKGVRPPALKESAVGALKNLLRITSECKDDHEETLMNPGRSIYHGALGYFIALLPVSTTLEGYKDLLTEANADPYWFPEAGSDCDVFVPLVPLQLLGVADWTTALYVTSFIGSILQTSQGDDAETEVLYCILSEVGDRYPDVIAMAYDSLHDKMKEVFATSSKPEIVRAVSNIFKVAMQQEPTRSIPGRGSASTLGTVDEVGPGKRHIGELEALGLHGLPNSFQFIQQVHPVQMCRWVANLIGKMEE